MGGEDRGVTPVVGAILLVGIVVVLAGANAYIVFGLAETNDPSPDVVFQSVETESAEHELVHEGGDELDGDRVTIQGAANPDALAGQTFSASDRLSFYPTEEEVQLVWSPEDDDSTYVLTTVSVDTALPAPDKGCDWVDSESNGGAEDVKVDGIVVNCDVETDKIIEVQNGGVVVGDIDSDLKEFDGDDATVYGSVDAEKVVNLEDGIIKGDAVSASADVKIDNGTVEGSIDADEVAEIQDGSVLEGDIQSQNSNAKVLDSTVGGDAVSASDDVKVDNGTVEGSIDAEELAEIQDGSVLEGDMQSQNSDAKVLDSTVEGGVTADGTVKLTNAVVEGHVYADPSDFDCTGSTINGQSCGSYTPKDPDDW